MGNGGSIAHGPHLDPLLNIFLQMCLYINFRPDTCFCGKNSHVDNETFASRYKYSENFVDLKSTVRRGRETYEVSKKRNESESVYASESNFGWSQKVFLDHPPNQNIYYVNVNGLGRPS